MTEIVGIFNLTPDSFSGDGLQGQGPTHWLARLEAMLEEGAAIIDIGAESTRPGATPISAQEEWRRVAPLVRAIGSRIAATRFSLDTYHPENARRACDAGFAWINDVSGGSPAMLSAVKNYRTKLVLMHSLSVPADKQKVLPEAVDPVAEVLAWGEEALSRLEQAGIAKDRVILDPGIGFGKTQAQSLGVLRQVNKLKAWGVPILIGHSRKSFLAALPGCGGTDRDGTTLAVSAYLAMQDVDYLRVHDVRSHHTMVQILRALR